MHLLRNIHIICLGFIHISYLGIKYLRIFKNDFALIKMDTMVFGVICGMICGLHQCCLYIHRLDERHDDRDLKSFRLSFTASAFTMAGIAFVVSQVLSLDEGNQEQIHAKMKELLKDMQFTMLLFFCTWLIHFKTVENFVLVTVSGKHTERPDNTPAAVYRCFQAFVRVVLVVQCMYVNQLVARKHAEEIHNAQDDSLLTQIEEFAQYLGGTGGSAQQLGQDLAEINRHVRVCILSGLVLICGRSIFVHVNPFIILLACKTLIFHKGKSAVCSCVGLALRSLQIV
jgi:hypothetical protein